MADSNLTSSERARVGEILRLVTEPSFEQLIDDGSVLDGMTAETAREHFAHIMPAAVELQARGVKPTDAAFCEFGGPPPEKVHRFMTRVDLGHLAGAQMRTAVEADMVPAPQTMFVEARTEPVTGPTKWGALHLQPPPETKSLASARCGAANTKGGVASALMVAPCGELLFPVVEVLLVQGHWDPSNYDPAVQRQAERALRDRAGFFGERFPTGPGDVVAELIGSLRQIEQCVPAGGKISAVLTGGRMRMGFPRSGPLDYGLGDRDAYIGADLDALAELQGAGLPVLFELPMTLRGRRPSPCDWTFLVDGVEYKLAAVEALLDEADTPWVEVPAEVVGDARDPDLTVLTLRTTAVSASGQTKIELELVYVYDRRGVADLFVTTLLDSAGTAEKITKLIAELAIAERARRRPGSSTSTQLRPIYDEGFLLRHQRRNYADRRSFGGVVQTAYGVLQLARAA